MSHDTDKNAQASTALTFRRGTAWRGCHPLVLILIIVKRSGGGVGGSFSGERKI